MGCIGCEPELFRIHEKLRCLEKYFSKLLLAALHPVQLNQIKGIFVCDAPPLREFASFIACPVPMPALGCPWLPLLVLACSVHSSDKTLIAGSKLQWRLL